MRFASRRRHPDPPGHEQRPDRGLSLIEVLVAVVLLGLGGIATMSALGGALSGSSVHEHKIVGLSVLETAAASFTEPLTDCSAYEALARDSMPHEGWGSGVLGDPSWLRVSADCSSEVHLVELRWEPPNTRSAALLRVSVGGPSVLSEAVPPGDEIVPIVGDTTCRITAVTAEPGSMIWWPGEFSEEPWGKLDQDVIITATKTGNCANLRAVIEPETEGELRYLPLNPVDGSTTAVRAVVNGREPGSRWAPGGVVSRFEHEMTAGAWTSMQAGLLFPLFTVDECVVLDVTIDPGPIPLGDDDRLVDTVPISATALGACDDVRVSVDTGSEVFSTDGSFTTGEFTAHIPPSPSGPIWAAGSHTVELLKPRVGPPDQVLESRQIVTVAPVVPDPDPEAPIEDGDPP